MSARRAVVLMIAGHIPAGALRRVGRWMLKGRRRRALRDRLARLLTADERTIDRGVGAGIRLSAAGSNPAYALGLAEPAVQAELARSLSEGMVFYDVGANVGFLTLIASRLVGPSGQVVAFEPLPENVRLLRHNLDLNRADNVVIVERALGASAGRARMRVPSGEDAGTHAVLDRVCGVAGDEVAVSALDDVVTELGLRTADVVKIDVEGGEVEVVAGMRRTLATAAPRVLVEVHDDVTTRPRERAVREALASVGYDVERIQGEAGGMPHLLGIHKAPR